MLDIKWIRENKEKFNDCMEKRGIILDVDRVLSLDEERRQLTSLIQQFQQSKNAKSKKLGQFKGKKNNYFDDIKRDVNHINEKLSELLLQQRSSNEYQEIMDSLPNILDDQVPYGTDEFMNKVVKEFGDKPAIENAKEHYELGTELGMMDFEQTAKISGSRFVTLKGKLAKLERALINFMIDTHTEDNIYTEISTPILVRPRAMYNTGQLPKFSEDSYQTKDENFRLISTGEIPLTNIVADSIQKRTDLPQRYVAYTECFRSEAGSAGRDTKGMIRNHQFGKVEIVSITIEDESDKEQERILRSAEEILQRLEISYRVVLLCSGDTGFSARKTYDIEVWLPGQKKYREISSVSNCGDFQSRRMKARYKEFDDNQTKYLHTLNGSALAVGRTIIAILENYQEDDGSIRIPSVLVPYMGGDMKIEKIVD